MQLFGGADMQSLKLEDMATMLRGQYGLCVRVQMREWMSNIAHRQEKVKALEGKTVVTNAPEDTMLFVNQQLGTAQAMNDEAGITLVGVECANAVRYLLKLQLEWLESAWRRGPLERICAMINDGDRLEVQCEDMVDTCRATIMAGVAEGAAGKKKGTGPTSEGNSEEQEDSQSMVDSQEGDDEEGGRNEGGHIEEAWGKAQDCCLAVKKCALGAAVDHIFALLDQAGIMGSLFNRQWETLRDAHAADSPAATIAATLNDYLDDEDGLAAWLEDDYYFSSAARQGTTPAAAPVYSEGG